MTRIDVQHHLMLWTHATALCIALYGARRMVWPEQRRKTSLFTTISIELLATHCSACPLLTLQHKLTHDAKLTRPFLSCEGTGPRDYYFFALPSLLTYCGLQLTWNTGAKEEKPSHTLSTNHYYISIVVVCCSVYLSTRFNFFCLVPIPSELKSNVFNANRVFVHDVTFQVMRGAGVQLGCCVLSAISGFRGFMVRMPLHPTFNLSSTVLLLLTKWGNSLFLPIVMVMCIV